MLLKKIIAIFIFSHCFVYTIANKRQRTLRFHPNRQLRNRLMQNERRVENVCYDTVGCFRIPHKRSPLTRFPESPDSIQTKFLLFRRDIKISAPEILHYEDNGLSLNKTKFNPKVPVKVIIHGFKGRWNDRGGLETVEAYLKIGDYNVILTDWENGARGPQYGNAAANTEVVGRQLGILLLHIINFGVTPQLIHLIGFSLGAHVAGCASEYLKSKKHLIGRITALDAASPLFRHSQFREKYRKLDREDAVFVDAVHTDASPIFTDGFGLLEPIGHADFFPNGGFEQPGCFDSTASVIRSHYDGTVTKETVCSHVRAWELFLETLKQKASGTENCQFVAYPCTGGLTSFQEGGCFPQINGIESTLLDRPHHINLGKLGEDVSGTGVMYLTTRSSRPFCGMQLQMSMQISDRRQSAQGVIYLDLNGYDKIHFQCQINNFQNAEKDCHAVAATAYDSVNTQLTSMPATVTYRQTAHEDQNPTEPSELYLNHVVVKDMYGQSWQFCRKNTLMSNLDSLTISLDKQEC